MLNLLGMIARLGPNNLIYKIGIYMLHHQVSASWFYEVQKLCEKYRLPSPLLLMTSPSSKYVFSKLVKKNVSDFWHRKFVESCSQKPSLRFLRPQFLPLFKGPHPLWLSCGSSASAVSGATIVHLGKGCLQRKKSGKLGILSLTSRPPPSSPR